MSPRLCFILHRTEELWKPDCWILPIDATDIRESRCEIAGLPIPPQLVGPGVVEEEERVTC